MPDGSISIRDYMHISMFCFFLPGLCHLPQGTWNQLLHIVSSRQNFKCTIFLEATPKSKQVGDNNIYSTYQGRSPVLFHALTPINILQTIPLVDCVGAPTMQNFWCRIFGTEFLVQNFWCRIFGAEFLVQNFLAPFISWMALNNLLALELVLQDCRCSYSRGRCLGVAGSTISNGLWPEPTLNLTS